MKTILWGPAAIDAAVQGFRSTSWHLLPRFFVSWIRGKSLDVRRLFTPRVKPPRVAHGNREGDYMFTRPRSYGMQARRIAGRGAALTIAVLLGAGSSAFAGYWDTDCHALKLKAATGAPAGAVRTYDFEGTCNVGFVLDAGPR